MVYTPIKNAGTKLTVGATPGASPSVEVKGTSNIDRIGESRTAIDITDLSDEWRKRLKGVRDAGQIRLTGNWSNQDQGQTILSGGVADEGVYKFEVEFDDSGGANPTKFEFDAHIIQFDTQPGGVDQQVQFTCVLSLDGGITETVAA